MTENSAMLALTRNFDRGIRAFALALYALMILVVGLQILTRWVLAPVIGSLPWTVNLSQMLLVYVTFIGAAVASGKHEHISLNLLSSRLSDKKVQYLAGLRSVMTIAFASVFIAGAYPLYQQNKGSVIGALPAQPPFTQAWLYVPAVVGGAIIVIYGIRDLWAVITDPATVVAELRGDETYDTDT